MKNYTWVLPAIMAATLAMGGCGSKDQKSSVNTLAVEQAFAAAEPALRSSADKAVAAIKAADYSGALAVLEGLLKNAKLIPEQQREIK